MVGLLLVRFPRVLKMAAITVTVHPLNLSGTIALTLLGQMLATVKPFPRFLNSFLEGVDKIK